jgi:hypothetical protein
MTMILFALSIWWVASLGIGGLMIWRPIPAREVRSDFRNFAGYALN